ncbi:MAG: branched-chain amino acid ABC transporter permease [Firmicutes bacterium]|jgi:branched-chain amino acid transport system permease protein|nr:branched-chain amino acid ABC transporter permease [Bacillota bacterium]
MISFINILLNGLLLGGIYAITAVGLSLQYGVARILNIAHGEFIMFSAFITWMLHTTLGINPLLCLAVAGPLMFVLGYLIQKFLYKTLKDKTPSPAAFEGSSMLLAFGLLFVIQNIAVFIWGNNIEGYTFMAYSVYLGDIRLSANRLVILVLAVLICALFYLFLTRTRPGKAIRAASQDPEAAGLMGVEINRMLALCFALGALMAGFAGVLISLAYQLQTTMGMQYTIIAIIVVVLGGLGSIPGSLIGGFLLGIFGSIVSGIEPGLTMAAYYLLFMVLLLVKPSGIFGR